jgi:hypothetical protein
MVVLPLKIVDNVSQEASRIALEAGNDHGVRVTIKSPNGVHHVLVKVSGERIALQRTEAVR